MSRAEKSIITVNTLKTLGANTLGNLPRSTDKPVKTHAPDRPCTICGRMLSVYNASDSCDSHRASNRRPW